MGDFFLGVLIVGLLSIAVSSWRRRNAIPYDDPRLNVIEIRRKSQYESLKRTLGIDEPHPDKSRSERP